MKIIAGSDFHGNLPEIPDCDLFIFAGDICPSNNHNINFQLNWFESEFVKFVAGIMSRNIKTIFIPGNHDMMFKHMHQMISSSPERYGFWPKNGVCEVAGIKIHSSRSSKTPGDWSFPYFCNAFETDEVDLAKEYENIPSCDIFLAHSPPLGYGDIVEGYGSVGSESIISAFKSNAAKIMICGHIHEGNGKYDVGEGKTVYNVSVLDDDYEVAYPLTEIEYEIPRND